MSACTAPGVLGVFDALEQQDVDYLVWKDIQEVTTFADGDTELDLLVPPAEIDRFTRVVRSHGFAQYRTFFDLYDTHIYHFIRFHGGKHYHLHVYDSLITGDHLAKEYCLDPLLAALPTGIRYGGVRTLSAPDELVIGLSRMVLKSARPGGIRTGELTRLRSICDATTLATAIERLQARVHLTHGDAEVLQRFMLGDDELADVARLRPRFDSLRRMAEFKATCTRLQARVQRALTHAFGLSNKALAAPAPAVALIGVDGSGKSTLAQQLVHVVRRKTSCRGVYLGGNATTYSLISRLARLFWGASAVTRRAFPGWRVLNGAYYVLQALFEYSKCRDRTRRIYRARRLGRRGIVHVFERYPIKGLFDYPALARELEAGTLSLGPRARAATERIVRWIDQELARAGLPAVVILIDTPYQDITSRRQLDPAEARDIEAKLRVLADFKRNGVGVDVFTLENRGSLEDSLATLCDILNQELCTFSS